MKIQQINKPMQEQLFVIRRIVLIKIASIRLFYHNDHLGSTSAITNETGNLVEETFYDPYGEILSGGELSRYDYEGKEFSLATEDYDYNFRKYDPELGIFTQPEQLFPNIYDPQQLNRYSFERRNPYKYVDEDGKFPVVAVAAAGAIVGLFVYDYLVSTGNLEYNFKGQLGYAIGGASAVLIAAEIVAVGGGSLIAYSSASVVGSSYSNIVTNLATDQPATQGAVPVAFFSLILGPISKFSRGRNFYDILGTIGAEELANQIALANYYKYFSPITYSGGSSSYQINQANQINPSQQYGGSNACYVQNICAAPQPIGGGSSGGGGGRIGRPSAPVPGPICGGCNPTLQCCL